MLVPKLSMDQIYNLLGWEELPGTRDEREVLRIWIDENATASAFPVATRLERHDLSSSTSLAAGLASELQ